MNILLHCSSACSLLTAHSLTYLRMFLSKSLMVVVVAIIATMLLPEANPEPQIVPGKNLPTVFSNLLT